MAGLEEELKSGFTNQQVKADLNVLFTAYFISNRMSANLKPFGITPEQFNVLRILRGKHPESMCQKDILERMIARNSNLTLIIKKLVKKKMVKVEQSLVDRRAYVINVTKVGLSKLKALDVYLKSNNHHSNKLSESEAFHLNALLDKIRE